MEKTPATRIERNFLPVQNDKSEQFLSGFLAAHTGITANCTHTFIGERFEHILIHLSNKCFINKPSIPLFFSGLHLQLHPGAEEPIDERVTSQRMTATILRGKERGKSRKREMF